MHPVLLVNGFLAPRLAMLPLKWRLQSRGLSQVELAHMPVLGIQDIARLAQSVGESVARLRGRTGATQVDIVGVSQGGLAVLQWLWSVEDAPVRRFVALGTPFHGTWFALAGLPLLGAVSSGVWQSLPTSAVVQRLSEAGAPPGIRTISVAIPGDPVAPPASCRLRGAEFVLAPPTRSPMRHQALILSSACADIAARALLART